MVRDDGLAPAMGLTPLTCFVISGSVALYKYVKISLSSPSLPFLVSSPRSTSLASPLPTLSQNLIFLAMKKLVVELELYDEKTKQKAMKTVSGLSGIQSIQIEPKNKKQTVIGDIDPVCVVRKLRKHCHTTIVSVGPAQEAKKEEPKKEAAKKEDDKKDGPKDPVAELVKAYQAYNPYATTHYYVRSAEEDPNSCVIC